MIAQFTNHPRQVYLVVIDIFRFSFKVIITSLYKLAKAESGAWIIDVGVIEDENRLKTIKNNEKCKNEINLYPIVKWNCK